MDESEGFFFSTNSNPRHDRNLYLCVSLRQTRTKWLRLTRKERHTKTNSKDRHTRTHEDRHTTTNTQRQARKEKISPSSRNSGSSLANPQGLSGATDLAQSPLCRSISVAYRKSNFDWIWIPAYSLENTPSGLRKTRQRQVFSFFFICYNDKLV